MPLDAYAPPPFPKAATPVTPAAPQDIAVVGSGISGLAAAWLLAWHHRVTLFEGEPRAGGHSHTVDVPGADGRPVPVDTGFIVYNEPAYPNLVALFAHLGIETVATDMSFAVSLDGGALEYAGTDLRGLFAQKRNLASPRFWSMLTDLLRFYRRAPAEARAAGLQSLDAFLDAHRYGRAFREDHLYPMAAAIWSTPAARIGDHPVEAFVRFCENHHLLQVAGRPAWRTVVGGSRRYVEAMRTSLGADRVRLAQPVRALHREVDGVRLETAAGRQPERYDQVVLATHAGQALALLEPDASADERRLLGAMRTTRNLAVLHTDPALMPARRAVWSSWNYLGERRPGGAAPCVSYWMNRLQPIATPAPLFLTLNPMRPPRPETLLRSQTVEHPLFDAEALRAQAALWSLQGRRRTWFCGAWFGSGFHEDGLQAGLAVAEAIGGVRRPWRVANESGRIPLPATATEAA